MIVALTPTLTLTFDLSLTQANLTEKVEQAVQQAREKDALNVRRLQQEREEHVRDMKRKKAEVRRSVLSCLRCQDKARQDKTKQHKTQQDTTRQDKARQQVVTRCTPLVTS